MAERLDVLGLAVFEHGESILIEVSDDALLVIDDGGVQHTSCTSEWKTKPPGSTPGSWPWVAGAGGGSLRMRARLGRWLGAAGRSLGRGRVLGTRLPS